MEVWEVSFKIRYDYPFMLMSEKYPGTKISMWCVWNREMLHVPLDHESVMSEMEDYVKEIGRHIEEYKRSKDGFVLTLGCSCDLLKNVWNLTERNHCVHLHPAVFLDGWGYYRVISFSEQDTRSLFADLAELGETELIKKRVIQADAVPSTVWVETFFTGLTDKQMEALIKAYEHGYYSSPRGITTDSVATSLGLARSTFEEHLRKAENKIMDEIMPYLKLFKSGEKKRQDMILPRTHFSGGR